MKRILAAGFTGLTCLVTQAGVCTSSTPDPCVNTYHIAGATKTIELVSELVWFGPQMRLHNVAKLNLPDALLFVNWTAADGSVLISGENIFGFFNGSYSWTSEWTGVLMPQPHVRLDTGSADFTGSSHMPSDCPGGSCAAKYYEWSDAPTLRATTPAASAVPWGIDATSGALQSVSLSPTDPTVYVYTDRFRYASHVQADAGGWRYTYTFENLTEAAVDHALPELGFAGRVAAHETATLEQVSALAPGLVTYAPSIRGKAGAAASGRFDALVPLSAVPEPGTGALLAAGFAVLARLLRRRR